MRLDKIANNYKQHNTLLRWNREDARRVEAKNFKKGAFKKMAYGQRFGYKPQADAIAIFADTLMRCIEK